MNYYVFQSKFFIVFIAIAAMAFAAVPMMKNSFADVSDSYIRSKMNLIKAEMMFIDRTSHSFKMACESNAIDNAIANIISENTQLIVCNANTPLYTEMIVYAKLKSGNYYAVDSHGVSCELASEPHSGFNCKDLR